MNKILACLALFCALMTAQSTRSTGTIEGTVVDSTGAFLPGVQVRVTQADSGFVRIAPTDGAGQFRIAGLPIGEYSLRIEKTGFSPVLLRSLLVSVGQVATPRLEMQPASAAKRLDVKEQLDALDSTATTSAPAPVG